MSTASRILLSGSNGMVGRNILEHPLSNQWDILTPTSFELDLTDASKVNKYILKNKPEIIIHAAGLVGGIQANIANPVKFLEVNTLIGINLLMSAYNSGVKGFLNLGSTCMYPYSAENPLKEDMILTGQLEPTNEGYALAKIMTTRLCEYMQQEQDKNLNYKTLIPCNLYGRFDSFDPRNSHLLPSIIHKVHTAKTKGLNEVLIWGDGKSRREFMYAGDLADAILKAVTDLSLIPNLMNIGLGFDYTINEYYKFVADVIGWNGEFRHDLEKPVGMKQKLTSIDLQNKWNWSPSVAMEEGIKKTYDFYIRNKGV